MNWYKLANIYLPLTRHSRDSIQVISRSSALDQNSSRVLLSILPHDSFLKQQELVQKQTILLKAVEDIFCLTALSEIQIAIEKVLQISQSLISGNIQCIYQIDNKLSQYVKVGSTENPASPIFPSVVSPDPAE